MEQNQIDKSNMREVILDNVKQFKAGLELSKSIKVPGLFKSITISGMGGSALPGNVLKIYLNDLFLRAKEKHIPIYQNRFYTLPQEAHDESLNIISSYSGNTEETIAAFDETLKNNLPCVGISSGGEIEKMCQENGIPHVKLPIGIQPRMATGYFFASMLQIMVNVGLIQDITEDIETMVKELEARSNILEKQGKELAEKMVNHIPVIYASTKFKSLAMIWKIKLNENSKIPAFWNYFPEANHNELNGFYKPLGNFFAVILQDENDHPQNLKRIKATSKLYNERGVKTEIIPIVGETIFSRIFSCLTLGEWVSYYLSLAYGQDPTPVEMVESLKKML